jgi:hypothetical protein
LEIRFRHILFVLIILLRGIPSTCQEISDSLRIHFQQSKSLFNESVSGNSMFYGSLADLLEMAKRKDIEIVSVKLYGAASPEGGIDYNKGLSKRRADRIASYISEIGNGRIFPEVVAVGRDWSGLYDLAVADSELPSREATLDLLCRLAMPNDKESEDRMFAQLKALDGGKPYRYMYSRLFPELRKAGVKVVAVYRIDDLVSDGRVSLETSFAEPNGISISSKVDVMQEVRKKPWYVGVKTNMLYDALLVPNGGLEIYIGKNWSIDAYWMYAWWKSDRVHNYWRTYGGDVELRKWLGSAARRKPLTGHHIGAYAQIVTYDFELGGRGYLADRWSYAAGVSYGYSLPVAKRLNIDFSIGLGYMGGEYKEYLPQDGHYVWQSTKRRHWLGPTKAEISLVWLIGRGNTNKTK